MAMVQYLSAAFEGEPIMATGTFQRTTARHLDNPYVACELMGMIFSGPYRQEGQLPELPDPPEGALR